MRLTMTMVPKESAYFQNVPEGCIAYKYTPKLSSVTKLGFGIHTTQKHPREGVFLLS